MQEERSNVDEALAFFGIKSSIGKISLRELDAAYANMMAPVKAALANVAGDYSVSQEDQHAATLDYKVLADAATLHYEVLEDRIRADRGKGLEPLVAEFFQMYKREIEGNEVKDPGFLKISEDRIPQRLMDKKFAYHFLGNVSTLGYDAYCVYGNNRNFFQNTTPPMKNTEDSRMAAVLLYSKSYADLPPILVELGNKNGGIKVRETLVSATEGAKKGVGHATVFMVIDDPKSQKIQFATEIAGQKLEGNIPPELVERKGFVVTEEYKEDVKNCVENASGKAYESMPEDMKPVVKERVDSIRRNADDSAYGSNEPEPGPGNH